MKYLATLVLLLSASLASAETITVGTYNIEHFNDHFAAHRMTTQPINKDPVGKELVDALRKADDEDNWETAMVITDTKFNPDILVIEEGCEQSDLDFFNKRWLNGAYETAIVFPTNTDRHQTLCMLLKPNFRIIEKRDKYYMEKDSEKNERGDRLFARGPSFCKVRTPSGYVFWVGVTHQKSKNVGAGGELERDKEPADVTKKKIDATKWRNREAKRTHEIMKELEASGPSDVMLLGDMNDALGMDPYEPDSGGDAIANLVGPPADGFILATKPLADAKQISYGGYFRGRYQEMIDHVVISKSMANQIEEVKIVNEGVATVASDHFPVMVKLKADPAN